MIAVLHCTADEVVIHAQMIVHSTGRVTAQKASTFHDYTRRYRLLDRRALGRAEPRVIYDIALYSQTKSVDCDAAHCTQPLRATLMLSICPYMFFAWLTAIQLEKLFMRL